MNALGAADPRPVHCQYSEAEPLFPLLEGIVAEWYKRYPADFIHGTMGLTLEEKGAYSLCLDLIYVRGEPIPDDARWLSGVCGVSVRKWKSLRASLIEAGKLHEIDSCLDNSRAKKENENYAKSARNFAESGAKGGRKRAENAAALNKTNGLGQAPLNHIEENRIEETTANAVGRATRLPDDWTLPDEYREWAIKEGWLADRVALEADRFHDYWIAASGQKATKRDWLATWRNWMRNVNKGKSNGKTDQTESIDREGVLERFRARDAGGAESGVADTGGNADPVLPPVPGRH